MLPLHEQLINYKVFLQVMLSSAVFHNSRPGFPTTFGSEQALASARLGPLFPQIWALDEDVVPQDWALKSSAFLQVSDPDQIHFRKNVVETRVVLAATLWKHVLCLRKPVWKLWSGCGKKLWKHMSGCGRSCTADVVVAEKLAETFVETPAALRKSLRKNLWKHMPWLWKKLAENVVEKLNSKLQHVLTWHKQGFHNAFRKAAGVSTNVTASFFATPQCFHSFCEQLFSEAPCQAAKMWKSSLVMLLSKPRCLWKKHRCDAPCQASKMRKTTLLRGSSSNAKDAEKLSGETPIQAPKVKTLL